MAETIMDYNNLKERVDLLERKTQSFTSEIAELQKKPNTGTELEEFETKAKNLYGKLLHKNTQGNGTYEMMDHNAMVDLVSKCFLKRDELTRVLYKHLSKILECLEKLLPILPELETSNIEIEAASKQLKSMQCRRQEDVWKLLANSRSGGSDGDVLRPSIIMAESSMSYMPNLESLQLMDDNRTYTQKLQEMMETVVKEQEESLKFISSLDNSPR
ncbi:hypothetical protein Btru_013344 [Bulinus truncatus]|nr:hypothetical protein Btru_013344 [Bulinus truncatus]